MRSVSADLCLDTIGNLFLEQLVNEPIRIRNEQTNSLLDLVMTNNNFMDELYLQDPIYKSDYKGDYDSMKKYFKSIDWNYLLFNENPQDSWNLFYDHFCFALNAFVPVTNKPIHTNKNKWVNSDVKFRSKSKRRSFNKY